MERAPPVKSVDSLARILIYLEWPNTAAQTKELVERGAPLFQELADPNLTFVELPTGHYPMFSRPAELTEILLEAQSN